MIIAPQISSDYFTWHGNTGVADITDPGISRIVGKRFYDDAADEGFIVRSERTGTRMVFTHDHNIYDDMHAFTKQMEIGDLIAEVYTSACGRFQIHILND